MRPDLRTIDAGVRSLVEALNHVAGVTTRTSCEGAGLAVARHRHAELAYVLFRHPLPLRFQDFLRARVDGLARIEDDGIYSRWPLRNRVFVEGLTAAVHAYVDARRGARPSRLRCPLPRLRAHLARALSNRHPIRVDLCLQCANLFFAGHTASHQVTTLLHCKPDPDDLWFAAFVAEPGNALDADLIAAHGWRDVMRRAEAGAFGPRFQRRWLRYRSRSLADLATGEMRVGVQHARRQGQDLDFYYDDAQAVFEWPRNE